MTQRSLALAAGTVALALVGIATVSESPAPRWPEQPASASEPERVRIEHELVRIPITTATEVPTLRASTKPKPGSGVEPAAYGRTAAGRPSTSPARDSNRRTAEAPSGLLSRTMQTIVGDGKYKPQPFPRPGG